MVDEISNDLNFGQQLMTQGVEHKAYSLFSLFVMSSIIVGVSFLMLIFLAINKRRFLNTDK